MEETKKDNQNFVKILIVGGILTIGLLVCAGAGLAYAYFSNENVPILSNVVEQIEKVVISDEKFATEVQSGLSDMFFTTASTALNTIEEENVLDTKVSSDLLNDLIDSESEIYSYKSKENIVVSMDIEGDDYTPSMSFTLNMDADSKYLKKDDVVSLESNIDASYDAEGMTISGAGDIKLINDQMFVKLTTIPALGFDLSELKDQWLSLDLSENQETAELMIDEELSLEDEISEEDLENIKELINGETLNKNIKRLDDEIFGDVRTYCYEIDLDGNDIIDLVEEVEEIWEMDQSEKLDQSDIEEIKETFKSLNLKVCTGRQDYNLYKLDFSTEVYSEGVNISIAMTSEMSDYNSDEITIAEPEESSDLMEFLEEFFGSMEPESTTMTYEEFKAEYEAMYEAYGVEMDLTDEDLRVLYNEYQSSLY